MRPVNVIIIGYGHSVDFPAMMKIANVTDGAVYGANSPAGIKKFCAEMLTAWWCKRSRSDYLVLSE
jgi:hypothetical protein